MSSGKILVATVNNVPIVKFVGDVRVLMSSSLDNYFSSLYSRAILDRMVIDLTETEGIDSTALGLLAKMSIQLRNRFNVRPTIFSTNKDITRILKSMSIDMICDIVEELNGSETEYSELNIMDETEESVRQKVIEAHQTLMALSEDNKTEFQDLLSALKTDQSYNQ